MNRASLLFLLAVYAGLEIYLWLVIPARLWPLTLIGALLILAVMIGDPWRRGETLRTVGLSFRDLLPGLRRVALPTILLVALLVATNRLLVLAGPEARVPPRLGLPEPFSAARFLSRFLIILPWALLQQGLLQPTFNRRLSAALGPGWPAAILNGLCFGAMHLPGPALTAATFAAGTWWSRVYQKKPSLWALVLSHAILSAAAQELLPSAWTHGFRVGPGYFHWSP